MKFFVNSNIITIRPVKNYKTLLMQVKENKFLFDNIKLNMTNVFKCLNVTPFTQHNGGNR